MENDRVRVFEVLAAPGDKSPMHTHAPLVAVSLGKARLRMTTPDGKSSIFDVNPHRSSGWRTWSIPGSCWPGKCT
jgi:hypothetical protein